MEQSGFWVIIAGVGVYGLVHSILASHGLKRLVERAIGDGARRFYRLFFAVFAILSLFPILALVIRLPDHRIYTIGFPWVLLTLGLQALAGWGLLAAVAQTDAWAFIGLRQVSEPNPLISPAGPGKLVTSGYYRYVRHPLYSFSFVLLWLLPVMSWNLLALVLGLSVYMLVGIWFEERKLVAEHGQAYLEYRRRTRMLIPKVL